ncbi:MAG: STAS-like domain-containing protein [Actinomycetota bacterium]
MRIHDFLNKQILVTRDSAQQLRPLVERQIGPDVQALGLDFVGIEGLTPSFMDELLGVILETLEGHRNLDFQIIVTNPPARLSSKFTAIGRGRGLSIEETEKDSWSIRRVA